MHKRLGRALVCACLCACAVSGCTHAAAKTVPSPPLDMPAPPPRDIEPAPLPIVDALTPSTSSTPPAQEPPRGVAPRPAPPRDQPRDQPRVEPPKPPAPIRPPTTLQTTPATADEELERGIRATLARASADLDRVDYRRLGGDARTQYDTAKRFILQADEAARAKNLVFARNLADKALALATQLLGR